MSHPARVGEYVITEEIASRAGASTYRAVKLGRPYAITVFDGDASPSWRGQVEERADVLEGLSHDNLVGFVETGDHEGRLFIATEFVAGRDLAAVIERIKQDGREISAAQIAVVSSDLCNALRAVHGASPDPTQVAGGPLRPERALLSYDGEVKLRIDIATPWTGQDAVNDGYTAPEQLRGQAVDELSDVFAVGAIMYRLLTGHALTLDVPEDLERGDIQVAPAKLAALKRAPDGSLERICWKAVHNRREARPASLKELLDNLVAWMVSHGVKRHSVGLDRLLQTLFDSEPHVPTSMMAAPNLEILAADAKPAPLAVSSLGDIASDTALAATLGGGIDLGFGDDGWDMDIESLVAGASDGDAVADDMWALDKIKVPEPEISAGEDDPYATLIHIKSLSRDIDPSQVTVNVPHKPNAGADTQPDTDTSLPSVIVDDQGDDAPEPTNTNDSDPSERPADETETADTDEGEQAGVPETKDTDDDELADKPETTDTDEGEQPTKPEDVEQADKPEQADEPVDGKQASPKPKPGPSKKGLGRIPVKRLTAEELAKERAADAKTKAEREAKARDMARAARAAELAKQKEALTNPAPTANRSLEEPGTSKIGLIAAVAIIVIAVVVVAGWFVLGPGFDGGADEAKVVAPEGPTTPVDNAKGETHTKDDEPVEEPKPEGKTDKTAPTPDTAVPTPTTTAPDAGSDAELLPPEPDASGAPADKVNQAPSAETGGEATTEGSEGSNGKVPKWKVEGKGQIVVRSNKPGTIYLDGRRAGQTPTWLVTDPGKHKLSIKATETGKTARRWIEVKAGEKQIVRLRVP